jgi:stalled ribosome alternative rescue factor ArfA
MKAMEIVSVVSKLLFFCAILKQKKGKQQTSRRKGIERKIIIILIYSEMGVVSKLLFFCAILKQKKGKQLTSRRKGIERKIIIILIYSEMDSYNFVNDKLTQIELLLELSSSSMVRDSL